jgi:hypothetical protein
MTSEADGGRRHRARRHGVALLLAALPIAGCTEVESATVDGYHPSSVEELDGSDVKRVTFTEEGARRTGLRTAAVESQGDHRVVPYEALIYDGQGTPWVYAAAGGKLSFQRAEIAVDRIEGDRVLLGNGPPAGTKVVTVGASEVYGSELGIEGGH